MKVPADVPKWGQLYFVELNADEFADLLRDVNGTGGFEDFLRGLQANANLATRTVKLTDEDIVKMAHLAFDYKQGGWENRLLYIFGRKLGPTLCREDEPEAAG